MLLAIVGYNHPALAPRLVASQEAKRSLMMMSFVGAIPSF